MDLLQESNFNDIVIPDLEIGSYEALWLKDNVWFKDISKITTKFESIYESILNSELANKYHGQVIKKISDANIRNFGTVFRNTGDYPAALEDIENKLPLLYYAGNWDLAFSPSIAVVGTRNPTEDGIKRTIKLVNGLIERGFTIVSGLAAGIDTVAHSTAINNSGQTIAVLGSPLSNIYPKENNALFKIISENFLAISQVPFLRYEAQTYHNNRFFFPERNKTMSALSLATIIVEASDTSGTLVQARSALQQGRKLFILASCFEKKLKWPDRFLNSSKNVIKVNDFQDIWDNLAINNIHEEEKYEVKKSR